MPFRPYLTIDIIALAALAASFLLALKLKFLMGHGKDAAPVKIILIVILTNGLLGLLLLLGGYQKFIGSYANYNRLTDIFLMVIGLILTASLYKVYRDYKNLIKKHEPNL